MPRLVISREFLVFSKTKNQEPRTKNSHGFTLIELMVAISIVAILATVGLVMYNSVQAGARDSKRIQDLEELHKGIQLYYNTNNSIPTLGDATLKGYFQKGDVPKDPKGGGNYILKSCASDTTKYYLCATLESCGSKCNYNAAAASADPCTTLAAGATGQLTYCTSN